MMYELKKIVQAHLLSKSKGHKTVLATVVALEGSSYRRPGVRMLIDIDGNMTGAVSGGCVEKEIVRQSQSVFESAIPKVMTYDGRYRLGCEGILYILIEPFDPASDFLTAFTGNLKKRNSLKIESFFGKKDSVSRHFGSVFTLLKEKHALRQEFVSDSELEVFEQWIEPCLKLIIFGAEHDAVQLCSYATKTGLEVTVVAHPTEEKRISDFPGAQELLGLEAENFPLEQIDDRTAVLVMTHSYVKDLKYLMQIRNTGPFYLGLLGPSTRREKLLSEIMERFPEIDLDFINRIHGPAGLNIGAETAQEIAIAILSEILAVVRGQEPMMLRDKKIRIHN